jgi:hypothetical protein
LWYSYEGKAVIFFKASDHIGTIAPIPFSFFKVWHFLVGVQHLQTFSVSSAPHATASETTITNTEIPASHWKLF